MHSVQFAHDAGLGGRCRCPLQNGLGTNACLFAIRGEAREARQDPCVGRELVAEPLLHRDEARDMIGERYSSSPPIQGCAISCSIPASVLAWIMVVSRESWRSSDPMTSSDAPDLSSPVAWLWRNT